MQNNEIITICKLIKLLNNTEPIENFVQWLQRQMLPLVPKTVFL